MIPYVHPAPNDLVFQRGDIIHLDCGFDYIGFASDWQKVAYILREGEEDVPEGLKTALGNANLVHEAFASEPRPGMTGWQATLAIAARLEGVDFLPSLYSHPIGYHGHALGPNINARDMDLSSPPERDSHLRNGAYRSIEFSATSAVPEYGGGTVRIPMGGRRLPHRQRIRVLPALPDGVVCDPVRPGSAIPGRRRTSPQAPIVPSRHGYAGSGPPAPSFGLRAPRAASTFASMRKFTTAGPIRPARDYHIPPLERINLPEVLELIRDERYFVLHAPRQTGKTSALLALRDLLNGGAVGNYRCAYINVEPAQTAREDVGRAMRAIASEIAIEAEDTLADAATAREALACDTEGNPHGVLRSLLRKWAKASAVPLVVLIDEIDAMVGDSLVSVLRQLRGGLCTPAERVPPERGALRGAGRARLPHPRELGEGGHHGGQRLQHQGQVAAPGRLRAGRGASPARPAHHRDRTGVRAGGRGRRVGADARAAVAGQRAGARDVLLGRGLAAARGPSRGAGRVRGARGADPAPRDPSGPARRQAARAARAAGDRAAAERRGGSSFRLRRRVRARPRAGGAESAVAHRQPDLRRSAAARAHRGDRGRDAGTAGCLVRPPGRRPRHGPPARRLPGLLSAELGALDPARPVHGGRTPAGAAGLPAPGW